MVEQLIRKNPYSSNHLDPVVQFQGTTFRQIAERYLRFRLASGNKPRSYQFLTGFWTRKLGDIPLQDLTPDLIEDLVYQATTLKPASQRLALSQLSGLLAWAVNRDYLGRNPATRVPKPKVDNARERWLRAHEVDKILEKSPDWLRAIVLFGVKTGMRFSEICNLRCRDYFSDDSGNTYLKTSTPTKNGTYLTYPLMGDLRESITTRVKTNPPDTFLFPGPHGGYVASSLTRFFKKAVIEAGLEWGHTKTGITFHTLRHTMATQALNSGVPFTTVKKMGNWKSDTMVQRYALVSDETLRTAAEHMDKLFKLSR